MISAPTLYSTQSKCPVFDSRKTFRLMLEAVSNPTRVVNISEEADKLIGDNPAFLAVAITLLDNDVSFSVCGEYSLSAEITSLTLARRARIDFADYIFISDINSIIPVIESVKYKALLNPQKTATLIIRNDNEPVCSLKFSGAGIDGYKTVKVSQNVKRAIILRDAQNFEYPQGIDLIFVSSSGDLFTVPRLVRVEAE